MNIKTTVIPLVLIGILGIFGAGCKSGRPEPPVLPAATPDPLIGCTIGGVVRQLGRPADEYVEGDYDVWRYADGTLVFWGGAPRAVVTVVRPAKKKL